MAGLHFLPDCILLGDDSRYEFLAWLLPKEIRISQLRERPVWVLHGPSFRMDRQDGEWIITTSRLPPRTTLFIPEEWSGWPREERPAFSRCAVFEEHPFGKEDNRTLLARLAQQNVEAQLVLMDLPYRHAYSDLSKPGEDLAREEAACRERGQAFLTIRDGSGVLPVLHWREPSLHYWRRRAGQMLESLHARVDGLEYDYEYFLPDMDAPGGILSVKVMDDLCSARTVERIQETSIWECYTTRALQILFPRDQRGGLFPAAEIYENCMTEWQTFLPIEADKAALMKNLATAARRAFKKVAKPGKRPSPFDRNVYRKMTSTPGGQCFGIIAAFEQAYTHFIREEVSGILCKTAEKRYDQLRNILNRGDPL